MTTLHSFLRETYWPYTRNMIKRESLRKYVWGIEDALPDLPKEVEEVRKADVLRVHSMRAATPVSANCILRALSTVFKLAVDHGLILVNPCKGIKCYPEKPRERFLSFEEQARLLAVLPPLGDVGVLIHLLLLTGARPTELRTAEWEWVRAAEPPSKGGVLRLPDAKRGPRTVYLPERAMKLLYGLPCASPRQGRIFPAIDQNRMSRGFRKAATGAAIPACHLYDLRHTFASNALRGGCALSQIGGTMGHRRAQTTMRYAHLAHETGLEVVEKANAHLG